MKYFAKSSLLISSTIALVLLFSCQKDDNKRISVAPSFAAYIAGYSSYLLSTTSDVVIEFASDVPGDMRDKVLNKGLFQIKPKVQGQLSWSNNRKLIFAPQQDLNPDTKYKVSLNLGEVYNVSKDMRRFSFDFKTETQYYTFNHESLQYYNIDQRKVMYLEGQIKTRSKADSKLIKKMVKAYINDKPVHINWTASTNLQHAFRIDSIHRHDQAQELRIAVNGKSIDVDVQRSENIVIPNNSDFSVIDTKITNGAEQSITIIFSEIVDPNQNLKGQIKLGNTKFTTVVESNRLNIYPRTRIEGDFTLDLFNGIKSIDKQALSKAYKKSVHFNSLRPQLRLVNNGIIMPSSKGLKFHFESVNLKSVHAKIVRIYEDNIEQFFQDNQYSGHANIKRVGRLVFNGDIDIKSKEETDFSQWNQFALNLDEFFDTEPGAIYRVYLDFDQYHLLNPCKDLEPKATFVNQSPLNDPSLAENDKNYWDYYGYEKRRDWRRYDRDHANDPCHDAYYMDHYNVVSQNIFCSNLGLLVKSDGQNHMTVATTDLITSDALSDVEIEVHNFQGQSVGLGKTDANGLLRLELNSPAFFVKAIRGHERAYARVDDGSALSMSMFNVNGSKFKSGVKGYIYGERDVWRPGDSIYLNLVLQNPQHTIPVGHPIQFRLLNPKNQVVQEMIQPCASSTIYPFHTATIPDAITGNWKVVAEAGPFKFSSPVKIETIRPNRLKIDLDFKSEEIQLKGDEFKGSLKSTWLHGADASLLKAKVDLKLVDTKTVFDQFENYHFDDRLRDFNLSESTIFEQELDEAGEADFSAKIKLDQKLPGKFTARFTTKVFEKGGGFSTDLHTVKVSPYNSYVGVHIPKGKGWRNALFNNHENKFTIARVDHAGNKINGKKVKVEIYYWKHRWWWDHASNQSNFIQNKRVRLINTLFVDINNGTGEYKLPKLDENYGSFIIRVIDPESGHAASAEFKMTYDWRSGRTGAQNKEGLTMLTFESDKEEYAPGEVAEIQIPSSGEGSTLVSIEKGSQIINQFWVKNQKDQTKIDIPITPEMTPNVFVSLTLIQPYEQSANDLPLRLYGVKSISVVDDNTILNPQIACADKWEPEKSVTIKVSEKNGKPMEYTLAVVDEGLLDLTGFRTPDAWNHFYSKEALGIKTWDIYDQVIGVQNGHVAGLLSVGGDAASVNAGAAKANRFPPVVKFLGPFKLSAGATNTHALTMPNYVGSVRVMVVASGDNKYGHADKAVKVKKPLMLLANMPRVLAPGEKLSVPVTVFAMEENIKQVDVQIKSNGLIKTFVKNKKLNFRKAGDKQAYFDIEVDESIGIGRISVTAKSGKYQAHEEIELDIRSSNPLIHARISERIEPGKTWSSDFDVTGLDGTNTVTLEATNRLPINLQERLQYLIRYPHGCIEQTTSSVFPQLFVDQLMDVSEDRLKKMQANIKAGIKRIHSFQLTNGGIGYWSGAKTASPWGTNYAGHFMLEAKQKGYALPAGYLKGWVNYQKKLADNWLPNDYGQRDHGSYWGNNLIQAYRLYTLALAGEPAIGAMNRMRSTDKLSPQSQYRLALAYHIIGQKNIAKEMIQNLSIDLKDAPYDHRTFGSKNRDMAMILETLEAMGEYQAAYKVAENISKELNSGRWYSTQSTAYMLLSMARFGNNQDDSPIRLSYNVDRGAHAQVNTEQQLFQQEIDPKIGDNRPISIKNTSENPVFVSLKMSGVPLAGKEVDISQHLNLKIEYRDMQNSEIDVAQIPQGSDFVAKVTVKHLNTLGNYHELALTQIFPSGWEIHNDRLNDDVPIAKSSAFDFQDIRDDRVYTYFDLNRGESKTFIIQLNAAFPGRYYLPAVNCEAMYDHDITATRKGQWVDVVN